MNINSLGPCGEISQVEIFSRDVKISSYFYNSQQKTSGGVRGVITSFSPSSRRRLLHAARNRTSFLSILTLTYPHEDYSLSASGGDFMRCGVSVKKHMEKVRKFFTYRGLGGLWFFEFQSRGAPHFHFLLTQELSVQEVGRLRRLWAKIVGSGCPHHLKRGVDYQKLRSRNAAASYAAKYSAKCEQKVVPESFQSCGRFWGVFGLPSDKVVFQSVSYRELVQLVRVARRAEEARRRSFGIHHQHGSKRHASCTRFDVAQILKDYLRLKYIDRENPQRIVLQARTMPNPRSLIP